MRWHRKRRSLFLLTSRMRRMQPSKSVSMDITSAPLAMGCTSCASEILSAGRNTMDGMAAAAAYADSAADVSPVDAQPTATSGLPCFRSRFTWLTSTVIPRSCAYITTFHTMHHTPQPRLSVCRAMERCERRWRRPRS